MLDKDTFPNLTPSNHEKTSEHDVGYNCIAWAAGDTGNWWQPGFFWPVATSRDEHGIGELVSAFASIGTLNATTASCFLEWTRSSYTVPR
jgi:hypothetical protein